MQQIGNGIAIIPNAPPRQRNSDVYYPYRPDSDFYYLTHFPEPHSVAVFAPGREDGEYILFCRDRDPEVERWDGKRAGLQGALHDYQADCAYPIDEIDEMMPLLLRHRGEIHCCLGRYPDFDASVIQWMNAAKKKIRSGIVVPGTIEDVSRTIHELRLFKQEDEYDHLEHAAKVSARAHLQAMKTCRPGMMEYQIQAKIECCFRENGCHTAYPSIVASGANACILHYIDNTQRVQDGDLLLIDAGAEYDCYAADITRTFPVNGKFSPAQKAVYEVVLEAQKIAIEAAVPGNRYSDVDSAATTALVDGLIDLGILKMSADIAIASGAYRQYYMHKVGHWLGLDVHDVGAYGDHNGSRRLEPGMYMTVEPGLYLSPSEILDEKWHGIGVRIEDDVLITEGGNVVMTADAPKTIPEIEQIMTD